MKSRRAARKEGQDEVAAGGKEGGGELPCVYASLSLSLSVCFCVCVCYLPKT
jgi:hypothetical protein